MRHPPERPEEQVRSAMRRVAQLNRARLQTGSLLRRHTARMRPGTRGRGHAFAGITSKLPNHDHLLRSRVIIGWVRRVATEKEHVCALLLPHAGASGAYHGDVVTSCDGHGCAPRICFFHCFFEVFACWAVHIFGDPPF